MFNFPRFFPSEKTRKNPRNLNTFTHALETDLPCERERKTEVLKLSSSVKFCNNKT